MTSAYADILENQSYSPQPSSETQDADYDYPTFDAPKGDTFSFDVDVYVQPSSQRDNSAEIAVLEAGENEVGACRQPGADHEGSTATSR